MVRLSCFLAAAFALMLACAVPSPVAAESGSWGSGATDAAFAAMLQSSFKDKGIVKRDRLTQDPVQAFCSDPAAADDPNRQAERSTLEADSMAGVGWPTDGQWLGNWKEGEKIAQSGRGLTWTDTADQVNGGNCYNCHQITAAEISYGTIGPSLFNYGKQRDQSEETMRATWAKIYNSKSNNVCSNMPRAGHKGILSEAQIKHLMALLLDPNSPVNQ